MHTSHCKTRDDKTMVWMYVWHALKIWYRWLKFPSKIYFVLNISYSLAFLAFGCGLAWLFIRSQNWLFIVISNGKDAHFTPTTNGRKIGKENTKNVHQESFTRWKNNTHAHIRQTTLLGHQKRREKEKESLQEFFVVFFAMIFHSWCPCSMFHYVIIVVCSTFLIWSVLFGCATLRSFYQKPINTEKPLSLWMNVTLWTQAHNRHTMLLANIVHNEKIEY